MTHFEQSSLWDLFSLGFGCQYILVTYLNLNYCSMQCSV